MENFLKPGYFVENGLYPQDFTAQKLVKFINTLL